MVNLDFTGAAPAPGTPGAMGQLYLMMLEQPASVLELQLQLSNLSRPTSLLFSSSIPPRRRRLLGADRMARVPQRCGRGPAPCAGCPPADAHLGCLQQAAGWVEVGCVFGTHAATVIVPRVVMVHGAQLDFDCLCSLPQFFLSAAEPSYTHAGMLMALGLTGHLRWAGQTTACGCLPAHLCDWLSGHCQLALSTHKPPLAQHILSPTLSPLTRAAAWRPPTCTATWPRSTTPPSSACCWAWLHPSGRREGDGGQRGRG